MLNKWSLNGGSMLVKQLVKHATIFSFHLRPPRPPGRRFGRIGGGGGGT